MNYVQEAIRLAKIDIESGYDRSIGTVKPSVSYTCYRNTKMYLSMIVSDTKNDEKYYITSTDDKVSILRVTRSENVNLSKCTHFKRSTLEEQLFMKSTVQDLGYFEYDVVCEFVEMNDLFHKEYTNGSN